MAPFLDENSLKTLMSSFVLSRLDYCNSLLINLPVELIEKLQKMQNHAARVVLKTSRREHVTPMLVRLHWLPVKSRIQYKTAVLCYKCYNKIAPSYMCELVSEYIPTRDLRSRYKKLMNTKKGKYVRFGSRAFSNAAPYLWKSLPQSLRNATTLTQFKTGLKTYLFQSM